jgi:hypothetical protein
MYGFDGLSPDLIYNLAIIEYKDIINRNITRVI